MGVWRLAMETAWKHMRFFNSWLPLVCLLNLHKMSFVSYFPQSVVVVGYLSFVEYLGCPRTCQVCSGTQEGGIQAALRMVEYGRRTIKNMVAEAEMMGGRIQEERRRADKLKACCTA
uniref:Uncharacterized protein n=1 Tax=Leersia perrieri TaxID=77586 RepID=A0A0D9XBK2_9ORYZ